MNSVVHFEIPADDLKRAESFYSSTFGWKVNLMPEFNYAMVSTTEVDENSMPIKPGAINGGMLKRQSPVEKIVITVSVENIDEALAKIEANGGKTVRGKMPVGDMGFAAYFQDTEGNVVGLWENKSRSFGS